MFVGIESYLDESTVRDGTDIFVGDAYDEVTDAVSVYISGIDCVSETVTGFEAPGHPELFWWNSPSLSPLAPDADP